MNQLFEEYNKSWLFFCHEGRLMIYLKNTTKVEAFLLPWNLFFFKQILVLMYDFFLWSMKVIFQMNDVQVSRWMKCLKNIAKVETFVLLSVRSKYFCICFLVYWMKFLFQMNQLFEEYNKCWFFFLSWRMVLLNRWSVSRIQPR